MRTFDPAFQTHIETGQTSLCNCWIITKTNDKKLGFTDHDQAINFDGLEFHPSAGFSPTATVQKSESSIDTSDVMGWLDDNRIIASHIRDGQYAGAIVDTWKVNWGDSSVRHHFRRDIVGEITEKDGVFKAELRSQHIAFNQMRGRLYQRDCNANFGDAACAIDANDPLYSSNCVVSAPPVNNMLTVTGLEAREQNWANGGTLVWMSGERKNRSIRIVKHAKSTNEVTLFIEQFDNELVAVGDQVKVVVGCDKSFSTCMAKFSNQLNFQGFPHIPGEAFVLKYPTRENPLDGKVLVR
ncbi:DUF2163 domain-containing protein [Maritalea sp.]|uniref:DUF2163 domain-containing protein n=1 Tax=Maritalea sp. TaxID=2003361 RepID=UPI003EF43F3F